MDYFAASSCDVTPASVHKIAHVLYVPFSHSTEVTRYCASILSVTELQRADRLVTQGDKALFKQRRAFRRYCACLALGSSLPLSQTIFKETEKGRPYLPNSPDYWFSFSSYSRGIAGAWSETHAVGIDIENQTLKLEATELARHYFTTTEAEVVERLDAPASLRAFFQFWSLKEAALKSIGEGLPFGLDVFAFELNPIPRVVHTPPDRGGPEQFSAHMIDCSDSRIAMITRELV
jgi:4'-phosphopantetheinyl transferase